MQHMTGAHKDWVTALNFIPGYDVLVSGDRRGVMKLWDVASCKSIGTYSISLKNGVCLKS